MNNLRMKLLLPAMAVFALSLSSCSGSFWIALGFGSASPDVSGKVVDARGLGTSFSGASVTLTNIDKGTVYHATVDSYGNWSVGSVKSGHYTASVSLSGDYFFTSTLTPFDYSGSGSVTAPTLAGIYTGDFVQATTTYIAFILMWNTSQELDLHFTGPDISAYTFPSIASLDFTAPDYSPSYDQSTAFLNAWNGGFGPNGSASSTASGTSTSGRLTITNSNRYLTVGQSSTQVGLATYTTGGYGPDTIMFYNYPTPYTPGTTNPYYGFNITGSSTSLNQLPYAANYWGGVGEIYIDAPAPNYISTSTSTTNATLYAVTANGDGSPNVVGVYTAPTNTLAATVAAVRLNIMDNQIQLVPQMQVVTPEYYRSAAGANASGVVSVSRGSGSR